MAVWLEGEVLYGLECIPKLPQRKLFIVIAAQKREY